MTYYQSYSHKIVSAVAAMTTGYINRLAVFICTVLYSYNMADDRSSQV